MADSAMAAMLSADLCRELDRRVHEWTKVFADALAATGQVELQLVRMAFLLNYIITQVIVVYKQHNVDIRADCASVNFEYCDGLLRTDGRLLDLLKSCLRSGEYLEVYNHLTYAHMLEPVETTTLMPERLVPDEVLAAAYERPFIGDAAQDFYQHIMGLEKKSDPNDLALNLYAKSISVIQSSGAGKSRMLSEVGKLAFTLPICIRPSNFPGWPPSDQAVYHYLCGVGNLPNKIGLHDDSSYTAHIRVSCFLRAALAHMLARLRSFETMDPTTIRNTWHNLMESSGSRQERNQFYEEVCDSASNEVEKILERPNNEPRVEEIEQFAPTCWSEGAKQAAEELLSYIRLELGLRDAVCIIYFDEAHWLKNLLWIILRQANNALNLGLWFVFMDTTSDIDFFAPVQDDYSTMHSRSQTQKFTRPFYTLGFDQNIIHRPVPKDITIGEISNVRHLAKYGRPLWESLMIAGIHDEDLILLAACKILDSNKFVDAHLDNPHIVLAVLSHRVFVDLIVVPAAAPPANRGVSNHMRLLTGVEVISGQKKYYTSSPSEPILALGAFHVLYNIENKQRLKQILQTFNETVCSAGLIKKNMTGEIAAQLLLTTARDYAAPIESGKRILTKPVPLLEVLEKLFGCKPWAGTIEPLFIRELGHAYVNFTHIALTEEPLPEDASRDFLAGLWLRGTALQFTHTEKAFDVLVVVYHGPIQDNAAFDADMLSTAIFQVHSQGDLPGAAALQPTPIPRGDWALPCIVVAMDLGTEPKSASAIYHCKMPNNMVKLTELQKALIDAQSNLESPNSKEKGQKPVISIALQTAFQTAQRALDGYNRFGIGVRGASGDTYGILKEADIADEFRTLLDFLDPLPLPEEETWGLQTMFPFAHSQAWMPTHYG